jgi:hypothetical protein
MRKEKLRIAAVCICLSICALYEQNDSAVALIRKVNDRWQSQHPAEQGNAFWHIAAYHTGNMAAYAVTGDETYRRYSEAWAEKNQWKGAKSDKKADWKYNYGETDEHANVDEHTTADFGVGAFLLAAAEMTKYGNDRAYWADLAYRLAAPVLSNMSKGELSKNMQLELSPTWDGRNKRVSYMECFGRLLDGIAPWLALPDDDTAEGRQRRRLRDWALKSYAHAVNPDSPDYLLWRNEGQPLVDAAFIASSFLRAPKCLWEPLDTLTKQRYIAEFQQLRRIDPPYTNWILFSATIETFLLSVGAQYDMYRIHSALRKIEEWYVGDGWYSDGEHFAFDYYNRRHPTDVCTGT